MEKLLNPMIEEHREKWAKIAKENGWYKEPFHLQVWINEEGEISDSVATQRMDRDYIVFSKSNDEDDW